MGSSKQGCCLLLLVPFGQRSSSCGQIFQPENVRIYIDGSMRNKGETKIVPSYTHSKIPICELTYPTIWKGKIIFNLALSSRYAIVPRRVNQNVHLAFIRPTEMWGVICLKNVCVWFLWVVDRLVSNHTKKTHRPNNIHILFTHVVIKYIWAHCFSTWFKRSYPKVSWTPQTWKTLQKGDDSLSLFERQWHSSLHNPHTIQYMHVHTYNRVHYNV